MNLKHILPILLFVLFTARTAKAQTVYITESGKKYHAKNCSLAKTGKQGMELAEAKKLGYEACKNCKAAEATDPKKDTKKATTGGKK